MSLNKLKGAGSEVEAAFFLFKAASLEKSFRRLCRSWCWNRLRLPGGWCWKRAPRGIQGAAVTSVSTLRSQEDPCLIFRRDGKLGGSKTSAHSHYFIRALCLNKSPGTRDWWVCLLLCLWCLWLGLGTRWNVKLQEEHEEEILVWSLRRGLWDLHLGTGLTLELLCLSWQRRLWRPGRARIRSVFLPEPKSGMFKRKEECLKRSPEGTFS